MKYTTNYNLKKPEATDLVSISDLNDNADTIDAQLKTLAGDSLKAEDAIVKDETNSVDYLVKIKLVDGKPVIECAEK